LACGESLQHSHRVCDPGGCFVQWHSGLRLLISQALFELLALALARTFALLVPPQPVGMALRACS
jgi:hypothetical protein